MVNTQISLQLLCFLYLFVELMITMNEQILFKPKVVVYGHYLVTLSSPSPPPPTHTLPSPLFNETLKQLTPVPILMQNNSGGDSVALGKKNKKILPTPSGISVPASSSLEKTGC